MRRPTRRALTHVSLFCATLFFIIYIGTHGSKDSSFAWTTIRYQTTAESLPKDNGVCPELGRTSKPALVVSRVATDGSAKWLEFLNNKYHLCIYEVDAPPESAAALRVPANRGHEAMAYLTFIIDNYASIPDAGAVFVHGSRFAWHNDAPDYDNAALLGRLDVAAALKPHGYHNLRCDWSASTCEKSTLPQGSLQVQANARLEPWNARAVSDAALPKALATLFGNGAKDPLLHLHLGRADILRSQCCAQFVVSRSRILQHSRDEYVALRQWLLDEGSAPPTDTVAGRIISYVWHILFMAISEDDGVASSEVDLNLLNTRACPHAGDCYCRLYGRCDLECAPSRCRGQYSVPPKFKLPEDWAEKHS